jgi:hypothetical protein
MAKIRIVNAVINRAIVFVSPIAGMYVDIMIPAMKKIRMRTKGLADQFILLLLLN